MALEYRLRFDDPAWLQGHREQVEQMIRELPTFVRQQDGDTFWLKDPTSTSTWAYDVRIVLEAESIFFEVASKSRSFREDMRRLYESSATLSKLRLEDCDDPEEDVLPDHIFR
jgi:endonuclease YncB( thermonuclease family)